MKFLHTGDWHIGKKLHGFDLLEEQQFAFEQVMSLAEKEQVDGIIIAGDLYDRSIPSVESVELFNQQLIEMNLKRQYPIFAVSGNHDSATRLETGGPWFEQMNFHLHTSLAKAFQPIEFGNVQLFLLPYFEPFHARHYFENDEIRSIEMAMTFVVEEMEKQFDSTKQQVLVAHFFVAGSEKSDSETSVTVGGLDIVPLSLLSNFSYVALGHLHNKNALQGENARYSGTLLKYSLSELTQKKGVYIVDITEDGTTFDFHEVAFLRDIRLLEETFETLMSPTYYQTIERDDYVVISLLDKGVIPNVMNQLRSVYSRIIQLERSFGRDRDDLTMSSSKSMRELSPEALFDHYFTETTGEEMTGQQKEWLAEELSQVIRDKEVVK